VLYGPVLAQATTATPISPIYDTQGTALPPPVVIGGASLKGSMVGSHAAPRIAGTWEAPDAQVLQLFTSSCFRHCAKSGPEPHSPGVFTLATRLPVLCSFLTPQCHAFAVKLRS